MLDEMEESRHFATRTNNDVKKLDEGIFDVTEEERNCGRTRGGNGNGEVFSEICPTAPTRTSGNGQRKNDDVSEKNRKQGAKLFWERESENELN